MKMTRAVAAFGVALLAMSASAQAQQPQPVDSFDELSLFVRPGDTITVTVSSGRQIKGEVLEISKSALALLADGARREIQENEAATIGQRRPDSLKNGAWWGLGTGAVSGFILSGMASAVASIGNGPDARVRAGDVLGGTLLIAGVGTGIGIVIDALVKKDRVIYTRSPSSARSR